MSCFVPGLYLNAGSSVNRCNNVCQETISLNLCKTLKQKQMIFWAGIQVSGAFMCLLDMVSYGMALVVNPLTFTVKVHQTGSENALVDTWWGGCIVLWNLVILGPTFLLN